MLYTLAVPVGLHVGSRIEAGAPLFIHSALFRAPRQRTLAPLRWAEAALWPILAWAEGSLLGYKVLYLDR